MKWNASTQADGRFFVGSLVAGDYNVQVDEDSLPAGYSTESLDEPQHVIVGASAPGNADFTARALRSISGRVLRYDTQASRYVPVAQAQVLLRERGLTMMTDSEGRYLFHDLAAGSYTLSLQNQTPASTHTVRLGGQPIDLKDVDFQITPLATTDAPLPPAPPPAPEPPAPIAPPVATTIVSSPRPSPLDAPATAVLPAKPRAIQAAPAAPATTASAQQHNALGRQLSKAGRYQEAIAELTEAIRLAPDFALAFNARAFALMMLHEYARAIQDLDQAIRINPNYQNAYQIRAAAKRALGDAAGAAADLKRSQQAP
jgi:tetratricopeptide (TPR) repeat protein